MQEALLGLLAARKGHFRYESGHHGDLWLDIPSIYLRPTHLRQFASGLAARLAIHRVEAVCGPLVEGAFLAQMVAEELGVEFYYAEQVTRTNHDGLYPIDYRIPTSLRPSVFGKITAVVDDVINAGSATRGALADLRRCGARPAAIGALLVLGSSAADLGGREEVPLVSLAHLASELWEPSACPLCESGIALESQETS